MGYTKRAVRRGLFARSISRRPSTSSVEDWISTPVKAGRTKLNIDMGLEKMIANNLKLLNEMLADYGKQQNVYQAGSYWQGYCDRISNALRSRGIDNFRSTPAISKGFGGDFVAGFPFQKAGLLNWKGKIIKNIAENRTVNKFIVKPYIAETTRVYREMDYYRNHYYNKEYGEWLDKMIDEFALPDSLSGGCTEYIERNGRKISINYIEHLMRIYNFSQHIDFSKINSVFEIGGAYGTNAHLLLSMYQNITKYVILDIPPVLYIATQYLKHHFNSDVIDYSTTKNISDLKFSSKNRNIIPICPWQIENFKDDIDLFWNSSSFQEMDTHIVTNYMKHIRRMAKNMCLITYTGGSSSTTISIEKLIDEVSLDYTVQEIPPSLHGTREKKYFIGSRKDHFQNNEST